MMRNIGIFWGIIGVILTLGAIMRFIVTEFYNVFVRGLSKRSHKRLVKETVGLVKIMEEDHEIFAFGSLISIIFHTIIMSGCNESSFLGLMALIAFIGSISMGFIYKFIYKDKGGRIKKYHVLFTLIYTVFLILHIIFN